MAIKQSNVGFLVKNGLNFVPDKENIGWSYKPIDDPNEQRSDRTVSVEVIFDQDRYVASIHR